MQSGAHYMQQQQAQSMSPQALMAARNSMLYSQQQPYPTLQQSQSLHATQMGMNSAGSSGLNMLQGEPHSGGSSGMLGYSDFGRMKQDMGSSEGRGGTSSDGGEALYLKSGDDGNWGFNLVVKAARMESPNVSNS